MRVVTRGVVLVVCAALAAFGCGDDADEPCELETSRGCPAGLVCEAVVGEVEPACFPAVRIEGRVFSLDTGEGIPGARVTAVDVHGAARSTVAVAGEDGRYALPLPARRVADGTPVSDGVTMRVAAPDHQPFPVPPRVAIPVDLAEAVVEAGARVVRSPVTDVGLVRLPEELRGLPWIAGRVEHPGGRGALITAELNGRAVSTATADAGGAFVLFNVPPGVVEVAGHRAGIALAPVTVEIAEDPVEGVTLVASGEAVTLLSGRVEFVAGGSPPTTVTLVLASTFDPEAARGEAPPGLRADGVTGDFEIPGVAPGRYAVLASFDNDGNVRDPDLCIAGTDVVFVDVTGDDPPCEDAAGASAPACLAIAQSFKVTAAITVDGPGAEGIEVIEALPPVLRWRSVPADAGYDLQVRDAYGDLVYEALALPPQPGSGHPVSHTWSEAALEPGMIYQFRVWSYRTLGDGTQCYTQVTEDLRGVFRYAPP